MLEYQITDADIFVNRFNLLDVPVKQRYANSIAEAERVVHSLSQVDLRSAISEILSQSINAQKDILSQVPDSLQSSLREYGITVHRLIIKDILFPKLIQQLFAQQLEAQIRAKIDLENARTTVATARGLKNAAQLMKDNENIKFIQYLETMVKIAAQGKHTFVLGNISERELTK